MEKIIDPVSVDLLKAELTPDKKLCDTNKADNEIYVVDCNDAPNVLQEIGRLREIAFRDSGGGTGAAVDLDDFDFLPDRLYKQIVIWDPEASAILGGYRYILGPDVNFDEEGQPILASSHLFHFSDEFIHDYLPHTIELGRSFVAPEYQSSKAGAKAIFALDNLWDGLAAIMLQHADMMYYFGKMTIYPSYPEEARDMVMYFLTKYFSKGSKRIRLRKGIQEIKINNPKRFAQLFNGDNYKEDYKVLKAEILKLGVSIPPLVNTYMNLSPTMDEFGNVLDSGIMITFDEMYPEKRARHAETFRQLGWRKIRTLLNRFQRKSSGAQ